MEFAMTYTADQEAFRKEVHSFLETLIPLLKINTGPGAGTFEEWQKRREIGRKLGEKGWLWPTMPTEYGGGGLTGDHAIILHEEMERYELSSHPYYDSGATVGSAAVLVWGNEEQKKVFLPPMFKGEVVTWQLLTEPEAGSDLASVKTLAIRDGDDYVINGHKTFVGSSHGVDQLWTIVMTDPKAPRHENTSWFVIPAHAPGITIMPLDLLGSDNEGHKNSVFFDNVRVPAFNLVGGENKGWKVASTHLEVEHGGGGRVAGRNPLWERLSSYCKTSNLDGDAISSSQDARDTLVEEFVDMEVSRLFGTRNFFLVSAKKARSYGGSQSSYWGKMAGLRRTGLNGQLLGYYALLIDATYAPCEGYVETQQRGGIVAVHPAGTADVQKLIIARRIGIGRTALEEAGRLE